MVQYSKSNRVMETKSHSKSRVNLRNQTSREKFCSNIRAAVMIGILLSLSVKLIGQGTNNNFDYDRDDFNVIFKELGITTFKFPIKQSSDQLLNIVIEEYENKRLLKTISLIDEGKKAFGQYGIDALSYFRPESEKDSIHFHRVYFVAKDSTIIIRIRTHGFEIPSQFSLSRKSLFSFNSFNNFNSENGRRFLNVNKPEILVYLYANSSEEKNKPLWCPTGLSKEQLLERFYYFIFVSVEPYKDK